MKSRAMAALWWAQTEAMARLDAVLGRSPLDRASRRRRRPPRRSRGSITTHRPIRRDVPSG